MKECPILFFKTFNAQDSIYKRNLYSTQQNTSATITFRSFSLSLDMPVIHEWINAPYSARFWQLKGYDTNRLKEMFVENMLHPSRHILIGMYNNKPVCEVDVYHIRSSELYPYIPNAFFGDCGIHFLMAPPKETFKDLSLLMLRTFMDAYFSYPFAGDLYAEPDELNALANRLAVKAGFHLFKKASLLDKTANIYKITKEQFLSQSPLIAPL